MTIVSTGGLSVRSMLRVTANGSPKVLLLLHSLQTLPTRGGPWLMFLDPVHDFTLVKDERH